MTCKRLSEINFDQEEIVSGPFSDIDSCVYFCTTTTTTPQPANCDLFNQCLTNLSIDYDDVSETQTITPGHVQCTITEYRYRSSYKLDMIYEDGEQADGKELFHQGGSAGIKITWKPGYPSDNWCGYKWILINSSAQCASAFNTIYPEYINGNYGALILGFRSKSLAQIKLMVWDKTENNYIIIDGDDVAIFEYTTFDSGYTGTIAPISFGQTEGNVDEIDPNGCDCTLPDAPLTLITPTINISPLCSNMQTTCNDCTQVIDFEYGWSGLWYNPVITYKQSSSICNNGQTSISLYGDVTGYNPYPSIQGSININRSVCDASATVELMAFPWSDAVDSIPNLTLTWLSQSIPVSEFYWPSSTSEFFNWSCVARAQWEEPNPYCEANQCAPSELTITHIIQNILDPTPEEQAIINNSVAMGYIDFEKMLTYATPAPPTISWII